MDTLLGGPLASHGLRGKPRCRRCAAGDRGQRPRCKPSRPGASRRAWIAGCSRHRAGRTLAGAAGWMAGAIQHKGLLPSSAASRKQSLLGGVTASRPSGWRQPPLCLAPLRACARGQRLTACSRTPRAQHIACAAAASPPPQRFWPGASRSPSRFLAHPPRRASRMHGRRVCCARAPALAGFPPRARSHRARACGARLPECKTKPSACTALRAAQGRWRGPCPVCPVAGQVRERRPRVLGMRCKPPVSPCTAHPQRLGVCAPSRPSPSGAARPGRGDAGGDRRPTGAPL